MKTHLTDMHVTSSLRVLYDTWLHEHNGLERGGARVICDTLPPLTFLLKEPSRETCPTAMNISRSEKVFAFIQQLANQWYSLHKLTVL